MLPVRFHHLKAVGRSPEHGAFVMAKDEGGPADELEEGEEGEAGEEEDDTTAEQERGTAVHALMFGTRRVTFYPKYSDELNKNGKPKRQIRSGGKWEQFQGENAGAEILTEKDYGWAMGAAARLQRYPRAMELLRGTGIVNEHTLLWRLGGRECRGTPDARGPDLVELKTCSNASHFEFDRQAKRMHYAAQLAWYELGMTTLGLPAPREHYIVAVEQAPPHVPQVYRIGPRRRLAAAKLVRLWFETLVNCERSGVFPGYCEADLELEDGEELELVYPDEAA